MLSFMQLVGNDCLVAVSSQGFLCFWYEQRLLRFELDRAQGDIVSGGGR